ncbi:predicted protein [Naegleria gruberi]|uniref:Predicted protein n=1 Tax=Naegleria gruberi TaxID=5762 RepID=D2VF66_NAEGR|nr:uncharacterized protein NAEGRDRAFT_79711 [Naegleria gruberi]EFC44631.1 predicted protein [Naegleria gruberi]|eukprot:XP_002677375.1 predicted protein [Naegleria gruberi strain NEG-M]
MKRNQQLTLGDFCKPSQKKVKLTDQGSRSSSASSSNSSANSTPPIKETFLINDQKNGVQVRYIPNFLSRQESTKLFNVLLQTCEFEKGKFKIFGKEIISNRQISAFGERDYEPLLKEENYSKHHRRPVHDEWPKELTDLKERIEKYTGDTFTFALINRYDTGESSIGWHSDMEQDIKKDSSIVSISLGAARDFKFRPTPKKENSKKSPTKKDEESEEEEKVQTITQKLENGSMVIMNYATQRHYQHSIPKRKNLNSVRLNITFRHVVRNKP